MRQLTRLGSTIDDAIGEAYDKAAVILEAGYPGGPTLDRLAQRGDPARGPKLPRSMLAPGSLDFSFSGLKTALLYAVRGNPQGRGSEVQFPRSAADLSDARRCNLAAAFQDAAVDAVIRKLKRAVGQLREQGRPPACLIIGGGVSANSLLRQRTTALAESLKLPALIPAMKYCVDNAAMIAGLAHASYLAQEFDPLDIPALPTARR